MIKNICVIGAGTMGHAIANVFAMKGYKVNIYEPFEKVRKSVLTQIKSELTFMVDEDYLPQEKIDETLKNITVYDDLQKAVENADYIIEAISEDIELKQEMFKKLDEYCKPEAIFASNTSSIPLHEMVKHLPFERKERTLVCHWYNPGHLIPLVELSCFGDTREEVFETVYELYENIGKKPVKIKKDVPGLIANRMLHALAREIFSLIEMQVASAEDIDKALKFGPGFRNATTGMLEVVDMGGMDIWCTVEDNLFKELSDAKKALPLLREKVQEGKLGFKTGEGFFRYPEEEKETIKNNFNKRLLIQLKASENY